MKEPFDSSRRKIERAQHHINDLDTKITQFRAEHPYEIVVEADPELGYKVHKFRLTKPESLEDFSLIIGDAVTNLRAALDHTVYTCAVSSGHANPKFRTCSFPFASNETAFDNAVKGCTSVPKEIRACLKRFRSYEGGHDALYALNIVCNWDKHALITPVLMGYRDIGLSVRRGSIESPRKPLWDSTKNEIELFRTNGDPDYEFAVTLDIALDGPTVLAFKPIVPLLNVLVDMVQSILMTIETEFLRLGFVK